MTEPDLPSGGHHLLPVSAVDEETADARSITFAVPHGLADRFTYRPGQFLTVRVPADPVVARCYSLSSAPHEPGTLRVTVKRVAGGHGSNWLCDNVEPGMELAVLPPTGRFGASSPDTDLLLVAGGSGITPVLSVIKTVLDQGSGSVVLLYANRDEASVIFAAELDRLARRHPGRLLVLHWLESVQGLPTAEALRALAAPYADREVLLCGPQPFMDVTAQAMKELDAPRVTVERFVSLSGDPFTEPDPAPVETDGESVALSVTLDGEQHALRWPRGVKLLDFLLANGLDAPFSCRAGQCSACACTLTDGEVTLLHNEILDDGDLAAGLRLGCQATAETDEVAVSYDE